MGTDRSQQSGNQQSSTTYTPTPEEQELNRLDLELRRQSQGQLGQVQGAGLDLIRQILSGQKLPGYFEGLEKGISPEITQSIVDQSLRDAAPGFYSSGLQDSGVRASISARTSGDIRRASEEFNLGNKLNLLNLGLGSSAQIQSPMLSQSQALGGRLAGLRGINTQGSFNQYGSSTPSFLTRSNQFLEAMGGGKGIAALFAGCWVASEIFGGWLKPKTIESRIFVNLVAPKWFRNLYYKFGVRIASFIKNKPILKLLLRPVFELFSTIGRKKLYGK